MTRLKKTLLLATIAMVVAAPSFAMAAENGAPEEGSWLGLMFFAINFALFVGILIYFAAPRPMRFLAIAQLKSAP